MQAQLQLTSITIGSPFPQRLAMFYARLLRGEVSDEEPPKEGEPVESVWSQVKVKNDYGTFTLNFEYEKEWQTPVWPSEPGKQHITQHLDILVNDLHLAEIWAKQCGAVPAEYQPQENVRVMLDLAGHPFCLFTAEG